MKRKTKEQREEKAKAALRRSIEDIALGAEGDAGVLSNDWFAGAHCLSRWLPALKARFGVDADGKDVSTLTFLWAAGNLHYFDNVDTATDFLFEHGVRV